MNLKFAIIAVLTVSVLTGCKSEKKNVDDLGRANAPASSQKSMPQGEVDTPSMGKIHTGTVLETIDASSYTYIRFKDKQNLEHWAAVLKGKFEVGKEVFIKESIVQKNFQSPTLKRTFDSIVFGNVLGANAPQMMPTNAKGALPAGHPQVDGKPVGAQMPEGHPPVANNAALPEGHPSVEKPIAPTTDK